MRFVFSPQGHLSVSPCSFLCLCMIGCCMESNLPSEEEEEEASVSTSTSPLGPVSLYPNYPGRRTKKPFPPTPNHFKCACTSICQMRKKIEGGTENDNWVLFPPLLQKLQKVETISLLTWVSYSVSYLVSHFSLYSVWYLVSHFCSWTVSYLVSYTVSHFWSYCVSYTVSHFCSWMVWH